jgi:hypothetical protein
VLLLFWPVRTESHLHATIPLCHCALYGRSDMLKDVEGTVPSKTSTRSPILQRICSCSQWKVRHTCRPFMLQPTLDWLKKAHAAPLLALFLTLLSVCPLSCLLALGAALALACGDGHVQ